MPLAFPLIWLCLNMYGAARIKALFDKVKNNSEVRIHIGQQWQCTRYSLLHKFICFTFCNLYDMQSKVILSLFVCLFVFQLFNFKIHLPGQNFSWNFVHVFFSSFLFLFVRFHVLFSYVGARTAHMISPML